MKRIIITGVLLVSFLVTPSVYCQEVTDWERTIYYETVNKMASLPQGSSAEDYNRVAKEIANKHGISYSKINEIGEKVLEEGLGEHEWKIIEELDGRFLDLPAGSLKPEYDRIRGEVARKYGISLSVLADIEARADVEDALYGY